jgi:hypothetical protein
MEEPKILKSGPMQMPEFWRESGTMEAGDHTVYNEPEEKTWSGFPVGGKNIKQLPLAYLPETVAWQDDGSDPDTYNNLFVWVKSKHRPHVVPKTVVLRGYGSEFKEMFDEIAETLIEHGITVVANPYPQATSVGLYPGLPITDYETMQPPQGEDEDVGVIEIDQFVGGDILEIFRGSERESYGFYRSHMEGSGNTETLSGYDVVFPTITALLIAHSSLSIIEVDGATGTGFTENESWVGVTTVLIPVGDPPTFEIHAMGVLINPLDPPTGPRYPVLRQTSSTTTESFTWEGLITRSADMFLEWIERCHKYKMVIIRTINMEIADPIIYDDESIFGRVHISIIDGINPDVNASVDEFAGQVGEEVCEIVTAESGEGEDAEHFDWIKTKIAEFFEIDL